MDIEPFASDAASRRPHVLIVEDQADARLMTRELLEAMGYATTCVENGREALGFLLESDRRPIVVLTDLMMPIMDGRELVAAVRANPALAAIPIVMMTASSERCLELPGIRVLRKPLSFEALLEALEAHARR